MSLIQYISRSKLRSYGLLLLLSSTFFTGIGEIQLFDWDEINFAESAREMIESGDYLRVQINYEPFWEKPPFFFWLQALSMNVFGVSEFAARFPNGVFGIIYLFTFYFIGKRHYSPTFGLIWALLFFTSILPHLYFKSGIIDPVFNYFIFLSIYFMLRVVGKDTKRIGQLAFLSGTFSGMSIITKGPVGFLLLGLTFAVYMIWVRFRTFPAIKPIVLFFAGMFSVIGGWISIEVANNGWEMISKFIAYQIELFNSPVAGHEQPFYYHFVVVFFGCFPMSILALPSFFKKHPDTPVDLKRWMLSLFWVVMILFSITTTKIIHYSSMSYIPLAFIAALSIHSFTTEQVSAKKYFKLLFLAVGLLIGMLITTVPLLLKYKDALADMLSDDFAAASLRAADSWSGYEMLIGVFFLLGVIAAFILIRKEQWEHMLSLMAGTTLITLLLILYIVMPKVESITQGPATAFFIEKQDESCYIETLGYKSYAKYFYARLRPDVSDRRIDTDWLIYGEIDRPVYMVSKIGHTYLEKHPNFRHLKTEGGFNFYLREVPK